MLVAWFQSMLRLSPTSFGGRALTHISCSPARGHVDSAGRALSAARTHANDTSWKQTRQAPRRRQAASRADRTCTPITDGTDGTAAVAASASRHAPARPSAAWTNTAAPSTHCTFAPGGRCRLSDGLPASRMRLRAPKQPSRSSLGAKGVHTGCEKRAERQSRPTLHIPRQGKPAAL